MTKCVDNTKGRKIQQLYNEPILYDEDDRGNGAQRDPHRLLGTIGIVMTDILSAKTRSNALSFSTI